MVDRGEQSSLYKSLTLCLKEDWISGMCGHRTKDQGWQTQEGSFVLGSDSEISICSHTLRWVMTKYFFGEIGWWKETPLIRCLPKATDQQWGILKRANYCLYWLVLCVNLTQSGVIIKKPPLRKCLHEIQLWGIFSISDQGWEGPLWVVPCLGW